MAMLVCPNCRRKVWSEASQCSFCNTPIEVIMQGLHKDSVDTEEPKVEEPEVEEPKIEEPDIKEPEVEEPEIEIPDVEEPDFVVDTSESYDNSSDDVDTSDILTNVRNRIFKGCLLFILGFIAIVFYTAHEISEPEPTLTYKKNFAEINYRGNKYVAAFNDTKNYKDSANWTLIYKNEYDSISIAADDFLDNKSIMFDELLGKSKKKEGIKAYMLSSSNIQTTINDDEYTLFSLLVAFSTDKPAAYLGTIQESSYYDEDYGFFSRELGNILDNEIPVIDGEGNIHLFHISVKPTCQMYEVDDPVRLAKLFAENEILFFVLRNKTDKRGECFSMQPMYGKDRDKILWIRK